MDTEQELYNFIKTNEKVTIKMIQELLSVKHVGALGKLMQKEKIVKTKLKENDSYGTKMQTYYIIKEEVVENG